MLAEEVLNMKISLTPEQIENLTKQIREALAKIENIGGILEETAGNKTLASNLEAKVLLLLEKEIPCCRFSFLPEWSAL